MPFLPDRCRQHQNQLRLRQQARTHSSAHCRSLVRESNCQGIPEQHAWRCARVLGFSALTLLATGAHALNFNLIDNGGAAPGSLAGDGFQSAADTWSGLLIDPVTVNLEVGFAPLAGGTIAQAGSSIFGGSLDLIRFALGADQSSDDDISAVLAIAGVGPQSVMLNRTSDHPLGPGDSTPYVAQAIDNQTVNNTVLFSSANAKALNLISPTDAAVDASITFNSNLNFDFDSSDGISSGFFDFVGVAIHEIGHSLGFISSVDAIDQNPGALSENDLAPSILDLFRYSALSNDSGVIDLSADSRDKYFSIDGGATNLAAFSEGVDFGDGRQASHWKDQIPSLGILDPTAATGETLQITPLDLTGLDVIGWDLSLTSDVAEPGIIPLLAISASLLLLGRKRRQQ